MNFQLFGAPQLQRGGSVVRGKATQRRRLALLALLAAAPGRTLSRDRLVGFLWPERDSAQARKLLSESLYVIRRELGEEVFAESSADVVSLNDALLDCDLWRFQVAVAAGDLETAASLSDARFMDGLFLDEAEEFERWLDGERLRIAEQRTRAVETLARAAEQEGRWRDAAHQFQRLLQDDPLSSRLVLATARALDKAGEAPTALVVLGDFEARLRRELEVAPEPEVLALREQLRRERPPEDPRTRRPSGGAPSIRVGQPPQAASVAGEMLAAQSDAQPPSRGTANEEAPITSVPSGTGRSGLRRWAPHAALAVVLVAALAWWFTDRGTASGATSVSAEVPRLAVLYFRDGSPQGDLRSVADLLTESLIEQLAGSASLEVVPVSGVRQVRDGAPSMDSVARRFRVGTIVDGSVNRRDEQIVVSVRLIDAESGAVLESSTVQRALFDLGSLERELGRELALEIRKSLGPDIRLAELSRETSNVRARQLVARANRERDDAERLLASTSSIDSAEAARGFRRADSLYRQAEIEDRGWLRPAIERGWSALAAARQGTGEVRRQLLDSALVRLDSLRLANPDDPAVLEVAGAVRWARIKVFAPTPEADAISSIITDLERAIETDPRRARAWATLSNIYWINGESVRAERAGRRALTADAWIEDAPGIYRQLFSAAVYAQAIDSASAWCARGRREYPQDWWFQECELTVMKYDDRAAPDPQRAWDIVDSVDRIDPPERAAAAGHGYAPLYRRLIAAAVSARAGDLSRARRVLDSARAEASLDTVMQLDMAPEEITLLLEFGDRGEAVERLEWAIARRPLLAQLVDQDPILRELSGSLALRRVDDGRSRRGTELPIP